MIHFKKDNRRFNFRAVAVISEREHIMLQTDSDESFWCLPGGRVEMLEFSPDTIKREINEELGWECQIIRPLWYVENFFQYEQSDYHEISCYYLTEIKQTKALTLDQDIEGLEKDLALKYKWFKLSELDKVDLQPEFLKQNLKNLPNTPEFIYFSSIKDLPSP